MQQDGEVPELSQVTRLSATSSSLDSISSATNDATQSSASPSISTSSANLAVPNTQQQQNPQQYLSAAFKSSKSRTQLSLQGKPQAKNGRQRSTSLMAPNEMPRRMTKDYKELARDFRMLKPFTRLPDGTYPPETRCVFCEIGSPKTVFFPCQHKCVCDVCMKLHDITADRSNASSWSACPVCMTDIRLMLPYTGKEEEEYWKWISEIKPALPLTFKGEFKEAAKRLHRNSVVSGVDNTGSDTPSPTAHPLPLLKEGSSRRHTWHSNHPHSHHGGDLKNCSIL